MDKLFAVLIVVGAAMILWGLVIVPAIPHVMLDVVLTPDELSDFDLRLETLQKVSQTLRIEIWAWTSAGVVVAGIGVWGLILNRRLKKCNGSRPLSVQPHFPIAE